MPNGERQDEIYQLEDELITMNQKLVTLYRLREEAKETIEIEVEQEYRVAKEKGDTDTVSKLSNEKLRKHETKIRLEDIDVELQDGDYVPYQDLTDLIDEAEVDKLRLMREIGFKKRQFVREYGRAGMQALSDSLL